MNTLERFLAKVEITENCWEWIAAIQTGGYGFFQGKLAHRLAYEWMVGPIPPGLTIDHLCYNRQCGNPEIGHANPGGARTGAPREVTTIVLGDVLNIAGRCK